VRRRSVGHGIVWESKDHRVRGRLPEPAAASDRSAFGASEPQA
jgi:hypothetical protein